MTVVLHDVHKAYPTPSRRGRRSVAALNGVTLEVGDAELMVVVGPSGSGKTTLLRCVAGLERVDAGSISVSGRDVTAALPQDRDVAMVFQDLALFPHLTAEENIAFGLRARKVEPAEASRRVRSAAATLRIEEILDRRPRQLSGGERQRVALARAIVRRPAVFLLDEPLSDLDAELRMTARADIRALQAQLGIPVVYVTHDQVEALTLGHRIAVMRSGRIEQVGSAIEVYDRPATAFVAGFIGSPPMNLFPAGLLNGSDGETAGVRPENLRLVAPGRGRMSGVVAAAEPIGSESIVHVDVAATRLWVRAERRGAPGAGDRVGLDFDDPSVHRFGSDGAAVTT